MTALRQSWTAFVSATKAKAASITDLLAGVGERMPSVASITATVNGVTITVTPQATTTTAATGLPNLQETPMTPEKTTTPTTSTSPTEGRFVIRYGLIGAWHYLVLIDRGGPVFSDKQGAAKRYDSVAMARKAIRRIAADCEDPGVVRTIRPVQLVGKKTVRR